MDRDTARQWPLYSSDQVCRLTVYTADRVLLTLTTIDSLLPSKLTLLSVVGKSRTRVRRRVIRKRTNTLAQQLKPCIRLRRDAAATGSQVPSVDEIIHVVSISTSRRYILSIWIRNTPTMISTQSCFSCWGWEGRANDNGLSNHCLHELVSCLSSPASSSSDLHNVGIHDVRMTSAYTPNDSKQSIACSVRIDCGGA